MTLTTRDSLIQLIRTVDESPEVAKAFQLRNDYEESDLDALVAVGFFKIDDVTDDITVTTAGRLFAGLKPEGVPLLDVSVAEITGNIAEAELAARYMDGKIAAIDRAIAQHDGPIYDRNMPWTEAYQHMAIVFRETANELRMGLHLPAVHIDGRVIPYNEDRSTGVQHQVNLGIFFTDVYERNVKAGWWTDLKTGLPKKRNLGELMVLMVTEMAEAYRAWERSEADDKLPQYPGLGVELGDLGIRWADLCGALAAGAIAGPDPRVNNPGERMFLEIVEIAERYESIRKTPGAVGEPELADFIPAMDVASMIDAKLDFNATRADHKIENRLKEGGKQT